MKRVLKTFILVSMMIMIMFPLSAYSVEDKGIIQDRVDLNYAKIDVFNKQTSSQIESVSLYTNQQNYPDMYGAEGYWGDCLWKWNAVYNTLYVFPGNAGEAHDAPWFYDNWGYENPNGGLKNIVFVEDNGRKVVLSGDCSYLFGNAYIMAESSSIESIDFSGIDTSEVDNMSNMFYKCSLITSLDLSSFNTAKVTNMCEMFGKCSELSSVKLSSFNTTRVEDMSNMFSSCSSLTSLDLSSFNTENVIDMYMMFDSCSTLSELNVSSFNTANVLNMGSMFRKCSSLSHLNLINFNTSKTLAMNNMFAYCSTLSYLNVSSFNTEQVSSMENMFYDCSSLSTLDLSRFNTSKANSLEQMFFNCYELSALDLTGFYTGQVVNMSGLFSNCSALTALNVSTFNTENVTNMSAMFYGCSSLSSLDLSGFDTSKVNNYNLMFAECTSLDSLDLSSFNTANLTGATNMFSFCSSLKRVVLGEKISKLGLLPEYEIMGHRDWYSTATGEWFYSQEINDTRLGIADTYTKEKPKILIADAIVSNIQDKTYTGSPITQDLKLTDGNRVLVENIDYTISYENNINPGTATIIITGIGDYTGSVKKTFKITSTIKPSKPVITLQPAKRTTIKQGTTKPVTFSIKAKASNGGTLSYQWYSNGKPIEGATSATYTIKNPSSLKSGSYNLYCMVTEQLLGGKASNKSNVSTLTVLAPLSFVQMTPQGKTSLALKWNKEGAADGYDVFFSRCNHGKTTLKCKKIKTIKGNATTTFTKTKLLANTCYKAYVRPFKMVSGKKVYLATSPQAHAYTNGGNKKFSNPKAITLNSAKVGIKAKASFQLKAKVTLVNAKKKAMSEGHAPVVRYVSSDTSVAKVSKTGKIVGVAKGSCNVYAITQNGIVATCKVTIG